MPFVVLRVPSVARVVERLTRRERRAYDTADQALQGEGCIAGGKRLAAVEDNDYPMCQRSLYGDWRMITVYRQDGTIVIIEVGRRWVIRDKGTPARTAPAGRPVLTKKKVRELELTAGAKPRTKAAAGIWSTNRAIRDAERALTEQAEVSYRRTVTDQRAGQPSRKVGASATPERA